MRKTAQFIDGNVIFLDIDGCLTTTEDGSSFMCLDDSTYRISESRLARFLDVMDETDSNVVISSNWRKFKDDGYWIYGSLRFRNNLPMLRDILGDRYAGDLPCYRGLTKSETLWKWGESVGVDFENLNFVIIDDDFGEGFMENPKFRERYVHCDPYTGIGDAECSKIREILLNSRK